MTRVAALGMFHEANSFSSAPASYEQFLAAGVHVGDEIRASHAGAETSMAGFLQFGDDAGVDLVPLWFSAITPMGEITAEAFERICAELTTHLREAGPFDAVLLALHGAAVAETHDDADGEIIRRVRAVVGPEVPIGVAVDLHANLTEQMVAACDVLTAYQTNPHVDPRPRAHDAAVLIGRWLAGEIRPRQHAVWLPIIPTINRMGTDDEPMRSLLARRRELLEVPGVLDISLLQGHGPVNADRFGSSVVVVADDDAALARSIAETFADDIWARRDELVAPVESTDEAVDRVARGMAEPVLLLDAGDNIGGGASGDSVVLLEQVLRRRLGPALAILVSAESAATAIDAGLGAPVELRVGTRGSDPDGRIAIRGVVRSTHDGRYEESSTTTHAGFRHFDAGPTAAIDLADGSTVVITSTAVMPTTAEQVRVLGIDPGGYRVIVAKGVHSPLTGYGRFANSRIIVDTPGPTAVDYRAHHYQRRPKPMIPFEAVVERSLAPIT